MSDVLTDVMKSKKITASQVLDLRRSLYNDGVAEAGEVERLFTMDEAATECDPSWTELFVEAVTDYIVEQVEPQGHISEENADWLIDRISRDGTVKTATELEILVKVLEKAQIEPAAARRLRARPGEEGGVDGEGPLARGGKLVPGTVGRDEAELIRRILYRLRRRRATSPSRAPRRKFSSTSTTRLPTAENDPAWNDLFVKAIANFMMAASGYQRAEPSGGAAARGMARRSRPAASATSSAAWPRAGCAARSTPIASRAWSRPGRRGTNAWKRRSPSAETITAEEAEWLARRMGRDGTLHENEKALLRFIRDEAPSIHPSLQSLIAKAA